jgi:ATP-dependent helicase HepA
MSGIPFQLGQRWVSDTEPELGLGVIVDDGADSGLNRITVNFPAAKERRTYAVDNAPIHRVVFEPGDEIKSSQGVSMQVTEVVQELGYLVYSGLDPDGNPMVLPELDLNSYVRFSRPQDRLLAGQIDKISWFDLRYASLQHRDNVYRSKVRGLIGPRIQLLPHQLFIASDVASRFAPRVLLADEVGLGKTIEAGLIIHQQLSTGRADRVLIVVPETLIHQWLVEMLRRFNLQFSVFDEERCEALEESNDNPFDSSQLILLSSEFLCQRPKRLQQAKDCEWDLLVVDEAHHLIWEPDQETPAGQSYRCVEQLSKSSQGLLLLTATPEQLGVASHFARLRLLDPDRYYDFEKYCTEESGYQHCNELVTALHRDDLVACLTIDSQLVGDLRIYLGSKVDDLISAQKNSEKFELLLAECVQHLLDHHGTGRVLFRNTRNAISDFPKRVLHAHRLNAPENYIPTDQNLDQQLHPELVHGDNWCDRDPRVAWIPQWLKENRQEKAVLICRELSTCQLLEEYLRYKKGVRSAAFHQELSLIERDRAAAYFADDIDGAQLLICSEIGSEGRNFQFAHHLILFDLPFNPDLLEQRIGRLARIGQTQDVNIHVPHFEHSAQARLLQWYQEGLNAIEQPCPAAQIVFEEMKSALQQHLGQDNNQTWIDFLQQTQVTTTSYLQKLDQGRNRLLELNSCRPQIAQALVERISEQETGSSLRKYMSAVFDTYGVDEDFHSEHAIVIHPGDHMKNEVFPGLSDEGLTATFDRATALSREDMAFLTWEHPMVTQVMDMIVHGESGNTAVGTLKLPPLKPGTLLLEMIFVVHCASPKALHIDRYFSESLFRLVLDEKNNLSKVLSYKQLAALIKPAPDKRTAQEIVKQAKANINQMLNRGLALVEKEQQQLVVDAQERMQHSLGLELQRLQTLAAVNPSIRQQEIDHLQDQMLAASDAINQCQLSLDMLRVIVCI